MATGLTVRRMACHCYLTGKNPIATSIRALSVDGRHSASGENDRDDNGCEGADE